MLKFLDGHALCHQILEFFKNYHWNVDVKVNGLAYYLCIKAIIFKHSLKSMRKSLQEYLGHHRNSIRKEF